MRQGRVGQEIGRDGRGFVGKRKFASEVGGPPTSKTDRSGRVKGTTGRGLGVKKGLNAG